MNRSRTADRLRAVDLALIAVSAPVWVPVFALSAAAVLITSGRPVFFIQQRVGKDGETFAMRKFRSMKNGDNPLIPDPDRITAVGAILRRTSLDELPQLLNVIDGSMSLVGPRPMLPSQMNALSAEQLKRLTVLPGLTGLAQISGRNTLSWDERFEFDVRWAERPTLPRYTMILRKTLRTVLSGAGVTGHDANDRVTQATENILWLDRPESLDLDTTDATAAVSNTASATGEPLGGSPL